MSIGCCIGVIWWDLLLRIGRECTSWAPRRQVFVAGVVERNRLKALATNFVLAQANKVAVYGERVAPVSDSVNPTRHEDSDN